MGSPPTAPPLLRLPHLQTHRSQPAVDFPRGSLTQELLEFRPHIGQLAWESKAGKFGTFVMFLGLAFGFVGFIAKYLIQYFMGIK